MKKNMLMEGEESTAVRISISKSLKPNNAAHTCNPITLGDSGWRIISSSPAWIT